MEYERIHKVQAGVLSPTKLRMKLLGAQCRFKKDGGDPSRASPVKIREHEHAKNRLLVADADAQESSTASSKYKQGEETAMNFHNKAQLSAAGMSMIHPMRALDEDAGNGSDSGHDNASTCSFEFHQGEKVLHTAAQFTRQRSSKWNDAEKWIVSKRSSAHRSVAASKRTVTKRVDAAAPATRDRCVDPGAAPPNAQPVSMKDVGTEMTPIPSQDPSRTGTPLGSSTPRRSRGSSMASIPVDSSLRAAPEGRSVTGDLDREAILKTRQEIAALGMQLGKMNIASWASKEDLDLAASYSRTDIDLRRPKEFESRAKAWAEAENSKHLARFKREELRIRQWESQQREKLEAELALVEARAEKMRSGAAERMAQKLELAQRTAEERRAAAESRMNRQAGRAEEKASKIRSSSRNSGRSGRHLPPSSVALCCSLFAELY